MFLIQLINLEPLLPEPSQQGGDQFSVTCAQAIQLLMELIMMPGSREPENVNPTENAISAVTKILKYNNKALTNPDEIIALWYVKFSLKDKMWIFYRGWFQMMKTLKNSLTRSIRFMLGNKVLA